MCSIYVSNACLNVCIFLYIRTFTIHLPHVEHVKIQTLIYISVLFTLSLSTFSGSIRFSAFGNSGSKVPVFELRENFLFDPLKSRNITQVRNQKGFLKLSNL